jgi:hypothetical protein
MGNRQGGGVMSYHGNMIDPALSELPKLKDAAGLTHRRRVYQSLCDAAYDAIGGEPWEPGTVEVEVAIRNLALRRIKLSTPIRCCRKSSTRCCHRCHRACRHFLRHPVIIAIFVTG